MKSLNIPEYDLKGVKGKISTMREVVNHLMTVMVMGVVKLMTHSKCIKAVTEPITGYSDDIAVASSYGILRLGVGKINVCLRNHNVKQITLPKWTAVGEITVANAILTLLMSKPTEDDSVGGEATAQQGWSELERTFGKIDLTGLWDWSLDDQKQVSKLIVEYASIFPMWDGDLGKTCLVKHSIRLMDNTPFKAWNQHIPPSMYKEL